MARKAKSSRSPVVTTRDIAARAGVSNATVSLALRHHPRISPATRARVQAAADELGYRPDPQIAKLMFHLRSQRAPGFQSTITALTTVLAKDDTAYARDIMHSAEARAKALGYAFTVMRVPDHDVQKPSVQRILVSRGVEGLLLLPMLQPRKVVDWLDWSEFSVVSATYGVLAPEFHRVVPHQFGNTLVMCGALIALGYRRIGLVAPKLNDVVVRHGFSAAVAWQGLLGGSELVRPLVYEAFDAAELRRWFKRERPDVIIAPGEEHCRTIAEHLHLRIPGRIGFAVCDWLEHSRFAGMDERPREIGKTAIDLLHSKILTGEKGAPAVSVSAMISGAWVPGASAPSRLSGAR